VVIRRSQPGSADGGNLMVVRGDDVLGAGSWRRHETAPASHCWVLGIGLLPQARGYGYGTQAHRLLVDYLFAHTTVHRIEAATETGNIAEQKALSGPDSAAKRPARDPLAQRRLAGRSAVQHPAHRSGRVTQNQRPCGTRGRPAGSTPSPSRNTSSAHS